MKNSQYISSLINPNFNYKIENNVYHFITDETHRPQTPKYLSKEI